MKNKPKMASKRVPSAKTNSENKKTQKPFEQKGFKKSYSKKSDSDLSKEDGKGPEKKNFGKRNPGSFDKRTPGRPIRETSKGQVRSSEKEDGQEKKTPFSKFSKKEPFKKSKPENNRVERPFSKPFKSAPQKKTSESASDGKIRLNKFISNAGICSRRDADSLIYEGLIRVNGEVITELGYKVNPTDKIVYENKVLKAEKHVYLLLNKPKDFITTVTDPNDRKTVMELVKNACKERIYPVGRLDRNTTGLLLLTNDGDLAKKLTHPSGKVKKIYHVRLDKAISKEDFEKIKNGIMLEDGPIKPDDIVITSPDKKELGIEVHEGRNRLVRRIFESLGYDVIYLDRVMYAILTKKDLPRGHWRHLDEKEIIQLKHLLKS